MAYDPDKAAELKDKIVEMIADGDSQRGACAKLGIASSTVNSWLDVDAEFSRKCARAREHQAEIVDARIVDVINRVETGELKSDQARVMLSGLQWRASKLAPRKYGDKLELSGDKANPIQTETQLNVTGLSTQALAEIMALKDAANRN